MHRKHLVLGSMVVAGAMLLGGCASGTTGTTNGAAVNKSVDGKGKTLTLWHYESDTSAMGIAWNQAIKTFEKETGAKVKFEPKSFEQIRSTSSQVLNSDAAPDVLEYNKGNATAGLLSSQGLLTNLDPAVKAYGWDKKLAPSLQTTAMYNPKGIMGSGNWYGVPNYGEYVEVFYNKDMFAKQNIAIPTTQGEFVAAMAKFKSAGITPLAESAAEYPLGQLWYQLALSKADRGFVNNYQLYKGKVNWQGPELSYATATIKDWVDKGYINKDVTGAKPRMPARVSSAASTRSSTPAAGGTTGSPLRSSPSSGAPSCSPGPRCRPAQPATCGWSRPRPRTRTWRISSSTSRCARRSRL